MARAPGRRAACLLALMTCAACGSRTAAQSQRQIDAEQPTSTPTATSPSTNSATPATAPPITTVPQPSSSTPLPEHCVHPVDMQPIRLDLSNRPDPATIPAEVRSLQLTHDDQSYIARVSSAEADAADGGLHNGDRGDYLVVVSHAVLPAPPPDVGYGGPGPYPSFAPDPPDNYEATFWSVRMQHVFTEVRQHLPDPCTRP